MFSTISTKVAQRYLIATALNTTEFANLLKQKLNPQGRRVTIQIKGPMGGLDTVWVTLINLPEEVKAPGAEAENNRMSFSVDGFAPDGGPPPTLKVKVEMRVSALSGQKLRSKSGPPEVIANYLAQYINNIISTVPPKFTHTKMAY